jgi:hypothetical protein
LFLRIGLAGYGAITTAGKSVNAASTRSLSQVIGPSIFSGLLLRLAN